MSPASAAGDSEEALRCAAARAASYLASLQSSEGLWPNRLAGGPSLDVLYALGAWFLGMPGHPLQPPHGEPWARRVLSTQNPDGGFPLWHGGPSDSRYGLEAYLALRIAGLPASEPSLRALGRTIADAGGLEMAGAIAMTRLLGAGAARNPSRNAGHPEHYFFVDYQRWPAITRQELVCLAALSIASWLRDAPPVPPPADPPKLEDELPPPRQDRAGFALRSVTSTLISRWARLAPRPLRAPIVFCTYDAMIREALRWPVLPVALYAALAVQGAGGRGSGALAQLQRVISLLGPEQPPGPARPCDYGIRDAALAMLALAPHGSEAMPRAVTALAERFRTASPASGNGMPRAGWPLGDLHATPDPETTALALLALRQAGDGEAPGSAATEAAAALLAAQREDGGWSAYAGEASAADVTGIVMEALVASGQPPQAPPIQRAVRFLQQAQQQAEACWTAARGLCRLYGTAMVLRGLRAAGVDDRDAAVLRAGEWLRSIQNADGGWGEHPESAQEAHFREAPSTPAHTAWALLGLLAGGDHSSESVRRGFRWLLEQQRDDGAWDPAAPALSGVAYAPYLVDPLGAVSFPLLALTEYLGRKP